MYYRTEHSQIVLVYKWQPSAVVGSAYHIMNQQLRHTHISLTCRDVTGPVLSHYQNGSFTRMFYKSTADWIEHGFTSAPTQYRLYGRPDKWLLYEDVLQIHRVLQQGPEVIWSCWVQLGPHFGGRGGRTGSAMVSFERVVVCYRLCIVTNALFLTIQPQFAIECLRRSNQQGMGNFGHNLVRKGLTDVSQILTWSGRDMGLSYAKKIVPISSAFWTQCTNVTDRQTTNGNIDHNKWNQLSVIAPKPLKHWL